MSVELNGQENDLRMSEYFVCVQSARYALSRPVRHGCLVIEPTEKWSASLWQLVTPWQLAICFISCVRGSTWRRENLSHFQGTHPGSFWTAPCSACPVITSCHLVWVDWTRLKDADKQLGPSVGREGCEPTPYNTSKQGKKERNN